MEDAYLFHGHGLIVHLVEHRAAKHRHSDRGAMMRVRRRGGAGREGDFQADDAFVGGVAEGVFVDD